MQIVASGFKGFDKPTPQLQRLRRRVALQPAARVRVLQARPAAAQEGRAPWPQHYQYVFIGSGVAGATVAKTLLEHDAVDVDPDARGRARRSRPRTAGSWWDYIIFDRKPYDYCYDVDGENTTVGNINWEFDGSRVMAYGGSTMHWGAWCLRYKPEDFRLRPTPAKARDWPISYDDLEPYYYQAEQYLSVCGDVNESWNQIARTSPIPRPHFEWTAADGVMIEAFEAVGIKPGQMPIARYRKCMTTGTCKYCPFGSRFTAQYVLDDLRADPRYANFEMRCHAPVTQIHADGQERRSRRSSTSTPGPARPSRVHADTFIVCSGTYESAKLLMRSVGTHWPHGIGNDHDLVGRFIVSHSFLRVHGQHGRQPRALASGVRLPDADVADLRHRGVPADGKIFLFKNRVLPNIDIAEPDDPGQDAPPRSTRSSADPCRWSCRRSTRRRASPATG